MKNARKIKFKAYLTSWLGLNLVSRRVESSVDSTCRHLAWYQDQSESPTYVLGDSKEFEMSKYIDSIIPQQLRYYIGTCLYY
jgi:hypothetical protein